MSKFKGKNVLVVGIGRTGVSIGRYLSKSGAKVTLTDMKQRNELNEYVRDLQDCKVEFDFGKHSPHLFEQADLIVVSPGVPLNIKPIEEARLQGKALVTEVDIAASLLKVPLIGVTGTNGKTTTTTLLGEMFKTEGKRAFVGGNIGTPLIDFISGDQNADYAIAELSSFQLDLIEKLVPAVAVFTNISEDHMDRYSGMDAYISAKKKLLQACDRNTYVVLNYDDPLLVRFGAETSGRVIWFTKKDPMNIGGDFAESFCGVYYDSESNKIYDKVTGQEEVYDVSMLRLFGDHNKENLMAAICAARMMGIGPKTIQSVIQSFPGVPHRLELIRRKNGVFFINDSKATNVGSLEKSLLAFKKNPMILIAGGKDKDADFTRLAPLVEKRCHTLILVGESKEKLNRAIGDFAETYLMGTFEEAVLLAYQKSRSGDIIMLSPGCASFDMFRNYEERGDYFKQIVSQL
ncbi:MAG: UDP-N-acetylmuramoyl-L-alanine--D-glutamate ligase [Bdellovibrionaceae bacterium]|nr:UDP-N-acetylmuramoyl-L-alanine--D-glutamate ligase [Pseudobdellovibrionaceae bacterium]|tara:strand:- start:1387 stop:2769 length:1383 start_codon:yes stop_codon:yes gene_type:complete